MLMINFAEPFHVLIALVMFLLVLWLARQFKKSVLVGLMLFIFIAIFAGHTLELTMGNPAEAEVSNIIKSITFDLIYVFLSFISYLWVDDIETKYKKKKSVDSSLDWFWSKV